MPYQSGYARAMTTVAEIEAAIEALPPDKVHEVAAWLGQHQAVAGAKPFAATHLRDVAGSLKYGGPARTVAEMDAAVLEHAKRQSR
jgi:hypothetical protein